jgi:hypothetical protein
LKKGGKGKQRGERRLGGNTGLVCRYRKEREKVLIVTERRLGKKKSLDSN